MQKILGLSRHLTVLVAYCATTLFALPSFSANSPTETWTVGRGEANGKPIFVRINMALKPNDPKYPFRAVYAMSFLHPTNDGRPEKAETAKANEIEDQLNSLIAQKGTGKFVAVQTHDGIRKFLFYVEDEKSAHDAEAALKVPKDYKVDLNITKDPTWMVYGKIRSEHERVRTSK
ncbi:MAG: hypothetical protein C0469_04490 [Cyanobacteria bacterium DS2.3.42]|nr:hypothetical protein [Cyanobacteria bacterium DS2.3.42]